MLSIAARMDNALGRALFKVLPLYKLQLAAPQPSGQNSDTALSAASVCNSLSPLQLFCTWAPEQHSGEGGDSDVIQSLPKALTEVWGWVAQQQFVEWQSVLCVRKGETWV